MQGTYFVCPYGNPAKGGLVVWDETGATTADVVVAG